MSAPDMLEIINGPEDGTEFPLSRAPIIVGLDIGCDVNIRLDENIEPFHARLTTVPDGYRVRKIRGGKLYINGKRAGIFRSRILRAGGVLEVGNTEMYLRCAPDGLAKRSRGLPTENDVFWLLRTMGKRLLSLLRPGSYSAGGRFGRLFRMLILLFIGAMIAGYFWPGYARQLQWTVNGYVQWVLAQISVLTSGPG